MEVIEKVDQMKRHFSFYETFTLVLLLSTNVFSFDFNFYLN